MIEENGRPIGRQTYTVPEVAGILGISRNSAYQAVRTGKILAVRIGRRLLVPCAVVRRLLTA